MAYIEHSSIIMACQPSDHAKYSVRDDIHQQLAPIANGAQHQQLQQRYGSAALVSGYTALPNVVMDAFPLLGLTASEEILICRLWRYWRGSHLPQPTVGELAVAMHVQPRTVARLLAGLAQRALIRIIPQHQPSGGRLANAYDLHPLIEAATSWVTRSHAGTVVFSRATMTQRGHEQDGCSVSDPEDTILGSVPQLPPGAAVTLSPDAAVTLSPDAAVTLPPTPVSGLIRIEERRFEKERFDIELERQQQMMTSTVGSRQDATATTPCDGSGLFDNLLERKPQSDDGAAPASVIEQVALLSAEFGDEAPTSSVTRTLRLCRASRMDVDLFNLLLDLAAARTRQYSPVIHRCDSRGRQNRMPYFFRVLRNLVEQDSSDRAVDIRQRNTPLSFAARSGSPVSSPAPQGHSAACSAAGTDQGSPKPQACRDEEAHPIWRAVLQEISTTVPPAIFERWLTPTHVLKQMGQELHVGVPSIQHRVYLTEKIAHHVTSALRQTNNLDVRLVFVVTGFSDDVTACTNPPTSQTGQLLSAEGEVQP